MIRLRNFGKIIAASHIFIILLISYFFYPNFQYFVWIQVLTICFFVILGIYSFRGYDISKKSFNYYLSSNFFGSFFGLLISLLFILWFPIVVSGVYLLTIFGLSISALTVVSYYIARLGFFSIPQKEFLVIGVDPKIKRILEDVTKHSHGKLRFPVFINPTPEKLNSEVEKRDIKSVVIADLNLANAVQKDLSNLEKKGLTIQFLPKFVEETLHRVPVELFSLFNGYYQIEFSKIRLSHKKRVFDVLISSLSLIVLIPILLLLPVIIYLEDRCNPFFFQSRVGLNGKVFKIWKFRTMKKNADKDCPAYACDQKSKITGIGRVLRPLRLDEILQFVNVLRGDMSFIGPRPEQPKFASELEHQIPQYPLRHKLKPGITGWAQTEYIYSSNLEENKKKLSYDLYYVKNQCTLLDFQILVRTIETVLLKKGAI